MTYLLNWICVLKKNSPLRLPAWKDGHAKRSISDLTTPELLVNYSEKSSYVQTKIKRKACGLPRFETLFTAGSFARSVWRHEHHSDISMRLDKTWIVDHPNRPYKYLASPQLMWGNYRNDARLQAKRQTRHWLSILQPFARNTVYQGYPLAAIFLIVSSVATQSPRAE